MAMRPYQIAATEAILRRIVTSTASGRTGTLDAGGYVWHTTGSGKTLTSFKTAQLAAGMEGVDKVIFVVDRKDLDHQTIKEYNRFAEGTVSANQSTTMLAAQINDPTARIIVTTIQKLSNFVGRNRRHSSVYDGHVVLVFDECHRSQFGDMHAAVTKAFRNYHLFGFTGTPIFAENSTGGSPQLRTTPQAFGDQLPAYTIVNAIGDRNVLPFRIDYVDTVKMPERLTDAQISGIDTERALLAPERVQQVVSYIREHFDLKTRRNDASYTFKDRRVRGFNSLFATASIRAARAYYEEFRRQQEGLPADKRLTIGIVYSYAANADTPGETLAEESTDPTALSADDRAFLDRAIGDYNGQFGTAYDTSAEGFEGYYEDISRRLTRREIDLVIVVNMFLTGFDSKTLNTLWVDKNLRAHGLIQAFSRTNRILNSVKTYGNIICFRDLQTQTDEAIALFGNKDAGGLVLMRPYNEYLNEYVEKVAELREGYEPGAPITSEQGQRDFIKLFGELLRLRNILASFDDFAGEDVLEEGDFADYRSVYLDLYEELRRRHQAEKEDVSQELVFEIDLVKHVEVGVGYILMLVEQHRDQKGDGQDKEIPVEISRAVASSPSLHSKRDLIEAFVQSVTAKGDVDELWRKFITERSEAELAAIITRENLNEPAARVFVAAAMREGEVPTEGTAITKVLPAARRFGGPVAGKEHYDVKKARVLQALADYVARFHGLM